MLTVLTQHWFLKRLHNFAHSCSPVHRYISVLLCSSNAQVTLILLSSFPSPSSINQVTLDSIIDTMTAAEKLNGSVNGTKVLDESNVLHPGLSRRVIFMRKLEVGEGMETEYSFDPPSEGEDMVQHTVALKRLVLGPDADHTELCVIEMETKIDSGAVEKFPLAYLRQDMLQVPLELFLSEKSTIRLVKGKGPVFLLGEYAEEWNDDAEEIDESSNEVDEEDLNESEDGTVEVNKENGVLNGLRKRKLPKEGDSVAVKKSRQEDEPAEAMDDQEKA